MSPLKSMILRLSDRKCLRLELHRKGQRYQEQLSPSNSPAEEALPRTYKFQGQTCLGRGGGVEAHTLLKRYSRNFLSHNHPDTAYLNYNSRSISTVVKCVFMCLCICHHQSRYTGPSVQESGVAARQYTHDESSSSTPGD